MTQEIPVDNPVERKSCQAVGERIAALPVDELISSVDFDRAGVVLRAFNVVCAAAVIVVMGMAASVAPDSRGHGTHEGLGMQPCGFRSVTRLPCPTCGMTTAFSEMAHFRLVDAFVHQPFGTVLFLLVLLSCAGWLYTAATGRRWPLWIGFFLRSPRFLYGMMALFLGSWGYTLLVAWLQMQGVIP